MKNHLKNRCLLPIAHLKQINHNLNQLAGERGGMQSLSEISNFWIHSHNRTIIWPFNSANGVPPSWGPGEMQWGHEDPESEDYFWLPLSNPAYPYLPCITLPTPVYPVYPCLRLSTLYNPTYPCLPLPTPVYPCLALFTSAYPCLPLSTPVYACIPLSTPVYPCLPLSSPVYPCLPLYTPAYPVWLLF